MTQTTTVAESAAAESTATETMLDAIRTPAMDSAAVVAARTVRTRIAVVATRTVTGRAVRAAGVAVTRAARQNNDGGDCQKRAERPLPLAELRRWFAGFRDGLFVNQLVSVHSCVPFLFT